MEENIIESSPSWLQRLKNESWEAELLVSAVAIFAIFKSFGVFDWICDMFIDKLDTSQYFIGYMITFLGFLAFGILGALFVIHFSLRAYWIGLVGLNSVFPDYSIEDSAYSKTFTEKMMRKLPRLQDSIKNLDEICSVIFSVAFTLLMIYLYLGFISSIYLLLYNLLSNYIATYILLIPIALLVLVYLVQMILTVFANIKKFKKNTRIQTWYFYSTIWGSVILYGPLYKNLLQITMVFGSNFKKKKALVRTMIFMLVFGIILGTFKLFDSNVPYLLGSHSNLDQTMAYDFYYLTNNHEKSLLLAPELETDHITTNATEIFIPIFDHEITKFEKKCSIENSPLFSKKLNEKQSSERRQAHLGCYQDNHSLFIDDKSITVSFLKADHPNTGQFGIKAFIDMSNLENGDHKLTIVKQFSSDDKKTWIVPFYFSN